MRHAAEVKRAGNRREPVRFAPSADRVGDPLRVPGQNEPFRDLRFGVALDEHIQFVIDAMAGAAESLGLAPQSEP